MNLYKFTNYLSYAGCVLIALYLIASIAVYHSTYGFKYSDSLSYLLQVSVALMIPAWCYKLWHFKAFKEENKNRLITWGVMTVVVILFLIFKS
ncbi:MAG: hypothetical protein IJ190_09570 [Prevotella sp.]|nr:hypothetical protein [Prevotella sp.]